MFKSVIMHTAPEGQLPEDKNRHPNIPSEANRYRHIHLQDGEAGSADAHNSRCSEADGERQRPWRAGKGARKDAG